MLIEEEALDKVHVISVVPQGSVLRPKHTFPGVTLLLFR